MVASWVAEVGRDRGPWVLELVDLRDWSLPMDDEPEMPHHRAYTNAHTEAWSAKVAAADAVVFVTPQYNWGYPAALKNALDHLYSEWGGKPAMIVTYGGHAGDKCAAQLEQVCLALHMQVVATKPGFRLPRERIEANTGQISPKTEFAAHLLELQQAFKALSAARTPV